MVLHNQRLKTREGLILHLRDGAQEGWGEVAPLPAFSQETLAQAQAALCAALARWQTGEMLDDAALPPSVAFGLSCALAECDARLPLTDSDGWFHTRDSGVFQQGEWHVLGRLDNQFFSGGEGTQPENIEALLLTHPRVRQACVVPVPDAEFGQRPVAVLDISSDVALTAIRDWLTPQLAGFQRPVAYYAMPAELHGGGIKIARIQVKAWAEKIYRNGVN